MSRVKAQPTRKSLARLRSAGTTGPSEVARPATVPHAGVGVPDLGRAARLGHRLGGFAVQRTLYNTGTKTLHVDPSYAAVKIPWNKERGYAEIRAAKDEDPTFGEVAADQKDLFIKFLSSSIDRTVYHLQVNSLKEAQAEVVKYVPKKGKVDKKTWKSLYQPVARKLLQVLQAHEKVIDVPPELKVFYSEDLIEPRWALRPKDTVPEKPDLPASGQSVIDKPNGVATAWNLVCSLIALIKDDNGYTQSKKISQKQQISSLESAVQALHDHYMGLNEKLEYDDTSTHRKLMKQWGYSLVFSGPVDWTDLHKNLTGLKEDDTLMVDITGHTVKVTIKEDLPGENEEVQDPSDYYQFHSDSDNYQKSELAQKVEYVYMK